MNILINSFRYDKNSKWFFANNFDWTVISLTMLSVSWSESCHNRCLLIAGALEPPSPSWAERTGATPRNSSPSSRRQARRCPRSCAAWPNVSRDARRMAQDAAEAGSEAEGGAGVAGASIEAWPELNQMQESIPKQHCRSALAPVCRKGAEKPRRHCSISNTAALFIAFYPNERSLCNSTR